MCEFKLKDLIQNFFNLENQSLPNWIQPCITNPNGYLKSYVWSDEYCYKIRLCELVIKGKFKAESLVIYPNTNLDAPIFGTEYVQVPNKRYFGAIDFHPINESEKYLNYLEMFPDTKIKKSRFYDLNTFFSKKFWTKRQSKDFYNEYLIWVKCYLHQYQKYLYDLHLSPNTLESLHQEYNLHMSHKDPAFGVLKIYFGKEFSKKYIGEFLFK